MRPPIEMRKRPQARSGWTALVRALRQIFGMPDYAAYLEHCRRAGHPAQLSERQFVDDFFERKGRAPRCC